MKLENQVCNLELSKKLKELGVKKDSVWFWQFNDKEGERLGIGKYSLERFNPNIFQSYKDYPAFTVAELGEMLPDAINDDELYTSKHGNKWYVEYMNLPEDKPECLRSLFAKTEADARAEMLIWLIENKHIIT